MSELLVPDFSSIVSKEVVLPYSKTPYLELSFSDPLLRGHKLIAIEDSLPERSNKTSDNDYGGERLTTVALTFPRAILAEANTHRVWSRNSASSRARSIRSTLESVMNNPYIPVYTRNKRGMSGSWGTQKDQESFEKVWLKARDNAVLSVLELTLGSKLTSDLNLSNLHERYVESINRYSEAYNSGNDSEMLSVHKQIFNRVLEPFQWHEAVVTSSYWRNFINLRNHDDADPAIHGPGALVAHLMENHIPKKQWCHLPFIDHEEWPSKTDSWDSILPIFLRSSGESAQISYHDKTTAARQTATSKLGDRLLSSGHFSPFEHSAINSDVYFESIADLSNGLPLRPHDVASNFDPSWVQFRPMIAGITK